MLGVQEGKSEEEIKDLMDELKLCAKQDIEKVTPKSIANKPWYFITFKDQAHDTYFWLFFVLLVRILIFVFTIHRSTVRRACPSCLYTLTFRPAAAHPSGAGTALAAF